MDDVYLMLERKKSREKKISSSFKRYQALNTLLVDLVLFNFVSKLFIVCSEILFRQKLLYKYHSQIVKKPIAKISMGEKLDPTPGPWDPRIPWTHPFSLI